MDNSNAIILLWHMDPLIDVTLPVIDRELYEKYKTVVDRCKDGDYMIRCERSDLEGVLDLVDAYYGDVDRVIQKCRIRKIPVMIQNVDVSS